MTKKDYVLIAAALRTSLAQLADESKEMTDGATLVIINVARALESDNPRFNKATFYKAVQS